jgi:hypothetical protein
MQRIEAFEKLFEYTCELEQTENRGPVLRKITRLMKQNIEHLANPQLDFEVYVLSWHKRVRQKISS